MISRGKGLGIGAKTGAFCNYLWRIGASAIYSDVAVPKMLFVKMPTNRFVQTFLTIKCRQTTKWRISKCIGLPLWKIALFGIFNWESALFTLVFKQMMQIVTLQALMGQNLPKLMVNWIEYIILYMGEL